MGTCSNLVDIFNPRRVYARVTVIVLCVCVSVPALAASVSVYIRNQRYSQVSLWLFTRGFSKEPSESYGVKKPFSRTSGIQQKAEAQLGR